MASNITLSAGVRANLTSLQSTAEMMNTVQQRLATGKKVNSAIDNPVNFFTAAGLSARANDLSTLLDSVSNAVQTINAADKGISAITKLVEAAKSTAKQALNAGSATATYALNVAGTNTIAADAAASGVGSVAFGADVAATGTGSVAIGADLAAVATGSVGSLTTGTTLTSLGITNGQSISISDGTNTVTHTVTNATTETLNDVITSLNGGAATWTAAINGSGNFEVTSNNNADTLTVSGSGSAAVFGTTTSAGPTNSAVSALTGILTVQQGTNAAVTVDFSTVTTRAGILSALGGIASFDGSGHLVLTASNNTDSIAVSGTGTSVSGLGLQASYDATNSSVTALTGILSVQQGSNAAVTADFSTITTRAGILAALGSVASFDGSGHLVLTSSNATDSLAVSGTGTSVSGTGLAASYDPTNSTLGSLTGTLTVQLGSGSTQTLTFGAGNIQNRAQLATALSGITGVTASISSNAISIASTSASAVTIGGSAGVLTALGLTAGAQNPTQTITTANSTRTSLQNDYNDLLTQISQLAADSSFNGVNLLNGDNLSVVFNEDGSSSLSINGATFDAAGLGLTAQTGNAFQNDAAINAVISALDSATSALRTQSSTFGSKLSVVQTRQDFTKNLINVLQVGADNLTLADSNEEGANLLALQTRQSLSTSALSMAVQADQNVLRLLQ